MLAEDFWIAEFSFCGGLEEGLIGGAGPEEVAEAGGDAEVIKAAGCFGEEEDAG